MTADESARLRYMTWSDTVRRLGHRGGGLTPRQLGLVHHDLLELWPADRLPEDLRPSHARLLDEVCAGLARAWPTPDHPPSEGDR